MLRLLAVFFLAASLGSTTSLAQEKEIRIEEEQKSNRLFLYAVNENLMDLDVAITVEGTGFRQRKGKPRKVRVPATSRVNMLSLVIERGQTPQYTYTLEVSDSLSRRALQKEFEKIRIAPPKPITIYIPDNCTNCDSIVGPLEEQTPYRYTKYVISENASAKSQLERAFSSSSKSLEEIDTAIISLGGSMYIYIQTFEDLMAKLEETEE